MLTIHINYISYKVFGRAQINCQGVENAPCLQAGAESYPLAVEGGNKWLTLIQNARQQPKIDSRSEQPKT